MVGSDQPPACTVFRAGDTHSRRVRIEDDIFEFWLYGERRPI